MKALTDAVFALVGGVGLLVAVAGALGLGLARELPMGLVALSAVWLGLMPGLGLAALLGRGRAAFGVSGGVWALTFVLGMPLYFPGERREALTSGFAWLAAPLGAGPAQAGAQLGQVLADALGEEWMQGQTPPTPAQLPAEALQPEPPPILAAPALQVGTEDEIALPYEGTGRSVRIPVVFEGTNTEEHWMLFDTGATYTTVNERTLRSLGVVVPRDAPEITMQTANGEAQARVVLLPRLWLGGFAVEGVTVAVCEACGGEDHAGLLGLNVSGQFTVTLDHEREELLLRPRTGPVDRALDISQWVDLSAVATSWADGRVVVEVSALNRSPRAIASITVGILCGEDRFEAQLAALGAGAEVERRVSLPRGADCDPYQIKLDAARW